MVVLSLVATKGNHGARYFPHSGYLALSPVKIEGTVKTTLDEDARPLHAIDATVAVRCYEARVGRTGIVRCNVLFEQSVVLWSKKPEVEWEPLATNEWPFRIVLPTKIDGYSPVSLPEYRLFWRLEAQINHVPQFGLGSRIYKSFDLRLTRYDAPPNPLPPIPDLLRYTTQPDRPTICYRISTPTESLGPTDIVLIELNLRPLDHNVRIHAINLQVERRIYLPETAPVSPPLSLTANQSFLSVDSISAPPSPIDSTDVLLYRTNSTSTLGSSSSTAFFTSSSELPLVGNGYSVSNGASGNKQARHTLTPLATGGATGNAPAKSSVTNIVSSQTLLTPNQDGTCKKMVALALPAAKSSSHWAQGVTMQTTLISLRFFIRAQVIVSTNQGSQETVDLTEREIFIVSTNQSERNVAQDKIEKLSTLNGRTKSKSPASTASHRRRKGRHEMRGHDDDDCTTPTSARMSSSSKLVTSHKTPRRPHTSGGIREASPPMSSSHSYRSSFSPFPDSPHISTAPRIVSSPAAPQLKPINTSLSPTSPSTVVTLNSPPPVAKSIPSMFSASAATDDLVRDWEEELERIQSRSSMKSAEMCFGRRTMSSPREPPPLPTLSMRPTPTRAIQAVEAS